MSVVLPHKAITTASLSDDPKKAILANAGDLSGVEIMGDMVLIGIYFRPEKTKGGIIQIAKTIEEDAYQGKAGLVLKWGPNAFMGEDGELYEQRVNVGEWCVFKVGDAWSVQINQCACRLVRDTAIKMKIKKPDIVF